NSPVPAPAIPIDQDQTANTLTISVLSVPDAPQGNVNTSGRVTATEDADYTFQKADFGYSDPLDNPQDAFVSVKITSTPTAGTLTLGGQTVNSGQTVL